MSISFARHFPKWIFTLCILHKVHTSRVGACGYETLTMSAKAIPPLFMHVYIIHTYKHTCVWTVFSNIYALCWLLNIIILLYCTLGVKEKRAFTYDAIVRLSTERTCAHICVFKKPHFSLKYTYASLYEILYVRGYVVWLYWKKNLI